MILELAKIHMGKMFFFGLKRKFGGSLNLLYTDTDSFVCSIRQKNWMQSLKDLSYWFDFSNLNTDHPLFSSGNQNVLGKFKFELKNAILLACIFLRSKCYSMLIANENLSLKEKVNFQLEAKTNNLRISKSKGIVLNLKKCRMLFDNCYKLKNQLYDTF